MFTFGLGEGALEAPVAEEGASGRGRGGGRGGREIAPIKHFTIAFSQFAKSIPMMGKRVRRN